MPERGKTEIINAALLYMGQDSILDPRGESRNAKLCAQVYAGVLAEILSGHAWTFATTAVRLQQLAEAPADARFRHQYQLPADVGRIHEVACAGSGPCPAAGSRSGRGAEAGNSLPRALYTVRGDRLLSNDRDLFMLYTRSGAEPHEMPALFMDYFAATIAERLFFKITGSRDGAAAMEKKVLEKELAARHADGTQTDTLSVNRPGLLLNARQY